MHICVLFRRARRDIEPNDLLAAFRSPGLPAFPGGADPRYRLSFSDGSAGQG
jgi:hypothetical protein